MSDLPELAEFPMLEPSGENILMEDPDGVDEESGEEPKGDDVSVESEVEENEERETLKCFRQKMADETIEEPKEQAVENESEKSS